MARQNRQPRKPRKTTRPTVVRTHLAVITGISDGGLTVSVHRENELVKAALLYADSVELLSLANQMVRQLHTFSESDSKNLWLLLAQMDDETLVHLGLDADKIAQFRQYLPLLLADPDLFRTGAQLSPELAQLNELADIMDGSQGLADSSMADLRQRTNQMRTDSGVAQLEIALDHKLVRFNENIVLEGDTKATMDSFIGELKRYLGDPTKFVLLDATIASLVSAMINEGLISPPERSFSNASEAVLGTGFIARLPAFTAAPMDEVIDLRQDLDEPLGRYRRKVASLRGEMRTNAFDEHVQAEVDALWRTEIAPTIEEIRQAMADHGLVRETVRAFGGNLAEFARGSWLPAGLAIVSANVFELGAVVATTLAGATAATPIIAKAALNRSQGLKDARTHDLYYLLEVDKRLESRA